MEQVGLFRCESYDPGQVQGVLRQAADALGVTIPQGKRVFIKPNCIFAHPKYAPASFTHPEFLRSAVRLFKGNTVSVGENGMVGFPTRFILQQAGYTRLAKEEQFTLLPLDEARTVSVPLGQQAVALPAALQSADFLVSLPKLKGNAFLPFSGALANHLGLVQHDFLRRSHVHVAARLVDLLETVKPNLIAVDGVDIGEGASAVVTRPRHLGAVIAGTNAVAVDVVCAAILGLSPNEVEPIRLAAARNCGPAELAQIQLLGDVSLDELRTRAAGAVQANPRVEERPLPKKIKIVLGKTYPRTGTYGALDEMFAFLERAEIGVKGARETTLVIGKSDEEQVAPNDTAAIVFLDDRSSAPYKGFTRIVRLRGDAVLTAQLLESLPFAMKLRNPFDDFRVSLWQAQLQSKLNAWLNRR